MLNVQNKQRFKNVEKRITLNKNTLTRLLVNQKNIINKMDDPEQFEKDLNDLIQYCDDSIEIIEWILQEKYLPTYTDEDMIKKGYTLVGNKWEKQLDSINKITFSKGNEHRGLLLEKKTLKEVKHD